MLPLVLAAVLAVFHPIPTPADVTAPTAFAVQGYVSDDDHTLVEEPAFEPETSKRRPSAKISFVAPASGTCVVAETETVDGKTAYTFNRWVDATAGERVYERVVLFTADDLTGDNWQEAVHHRYRIVVACVKDKELLWSSFYEVPVSENPET